MAFVLGIRRAGYLPGYRNGSGISGFYTGGKVQGPKRVRMDKQLQLDAIAGV